MVLRDKERKPQTSEHIYLYFKIKFNQYSNNNQYSVFQNESQIKDGSQVED